MPTPEQYPYWMGVIMVAVLGFLFKHHFNKLTGDIEKKADKSEIHELRQELKDTREAREKDMERMDRLGNERYAELKAMFDQRISDMERHLSDKLSLILRQVEK